MNQHPEQSGTFFFHPHHTEQTQFNQTDVMAIVHEATNYLCQVIHQYSQHLKPATAQQQQHQPMHPEPQLTELHFTFPAPPPMVQRVVVNGPADQDVPPFVMVPVSAPPLQYYDLN